MKKNFRPEYKLLNSICLDKTDLLREGVQEKEYIPFFVNRCLSYFMDTIFYCNQMNSLWNLPKQLQYDYLRVSVRPRKRFSKWLKQESDDRIDALKTLYGYSHAKAKQVVDLISEDQWKSIFELIDQGGTNTKIPK
jgi:hypothetical protein